MDNENDAIIILYTTFPNSYAAEKVGKYLVEQRLAGCVNILPKMTAIYEWQGQIVQDRETVMLVKTRASFLERVTTVTRAQHPYETPAILAIDCCGGSKDYCDWICEQTSSPKP